MNIKRVQVSILKNISLKMDFVLEISADADEMLPYVVFIVCQSTPLMVSCLKLNTQFANIFISINFNNGLGA